MSPNSSSKPNLNNLSIGKITQFWIPLLLTWLMMSVEGPFIAAIAARLPEAKMNLAAFGIAFSLALVIEAPVIMILSAAIPIVNGRETLRKMTNFTHALNLIVTVFLLILVIPPLFTFIGTKLIALPENITRLTHIATLLFLPWAPAIGYRRLYQAILIKNHKTRMVTAGTVTRLISMSLTAFILYKIGGVPGAYTGAIALSIGVTAEAIASRIMASSYLRELQNSEDAEADRWSYKAIWNFYYPLALTSFIGLGVRPVMVFFLGRSRMAIESLAVMPVVNTFLFIFSAVGLSFQEVGIALMDKDFKNYKVIRNFATAIAVGCSAIYSVIAFTPLAEIWFHNVSGLTAQLTDFSRIPAMLLFLMPALSVTLSFQRAMMVNISKTGFISKATFLEVVGIISVLFLGISTMNLVGAVAAAAAITAGRIMANTRLLFAFRSNRHLFHPTSSGVRT